MKVGDSGKVLSVNLKSNRGISDVVKNLKIGQAVSARIISSQGDRAVLDINGKRLRADFINGVPDKKIIQLILTDKSALNVVFKLADADSIDSFSKIFSSLTLFSNFEIENLSLHSLMKFINSLAPDIFELNLFLLGLKKEDKKQSGQERFFKMLLEKGLFLSSIRYISYVLSANTPLVFISYFINTLGWKKKNADKEKLDEDAEKEFLKILEQGENEIIECAIDVFGKGAWDNPVYSNAFIPYGEDFIEFDYIYYNNSFLCTIDLTFLGQIDIMIRDYNKVAEISFFSVNDETELYLNKEKNDLINLLELNNIKNAIIQVYNRKKMVDKLSLLAADFYTKSGFDVKV